MLAKADFTVRATATPRAAPCLTPAQAAAVAQIARAIEVQAGFPQDVEWALDDAGVQVLQARPVTALPPRWTRDESAERFPNPVTPLAWDFAEAGFHDALAASFVRMGLPKLRAKWFAAFDGYIYGNQTAVDLYLGQALVPAGSLDALRAALPDLVRRFTWLLELPGEWERSLDQFLMDVGRLGADPLDGQSAAAIWDHIGQINATGRRYFRHNIAISVGHSAVHKALRALLASLTPNADATYDALMAPVRTRTGQVNAALDHLAALAREQPGLAALLRDHTAAAVLAGGQLDRYPAFQAAWTGLMHEHGHRELDFDPYHPGWAEAPWAALEAVRARLDSPVPAPRSPLADRLGAETAMRRLTAELPDDLALLLSELVRLARSTPNWTTPNITIPPASAPLCAVRSRRSGRRRRRLVPLSSRSIYSSRTRPILRTPWHRTVPRHGSASAPKSLRQSRPMHGNGRCRRRGRPAASWIWQTPRAA